MAITTGEMMMLGTVIFSIRTKTYDALSVSDTYEWASQQRLGREPALQSMGRGSKKMTLSGVIFPMFQPTRDPDVVVGISQLDSLRELAELRNPVQLQSGYGRNFGLFVIESITEEQSNHISSGAPRKQTYSISLVEYGEDTL